MTNSHTHADTTVVASSHTHSDERVTTITNDAPPLLVMKYTHTHTFPRSSYNCQKVRIRTRTAVRELSSPGLDSSKTIIETFYVSNTQIVRSVVEDN